MSRPIPPPIGESELEKLASKLPETLIPNFQLVSKLMVDTFVSPDGSGPDVNITLLFH